MFIVICAERKQYYRRLYTSLKWVIVFFVYFSILFYNREESCFVYSLFLDHVISFFIKLIFSRKRFIRWIVEALLDYKIYYSFITCLHFPIVCQSFRLWSYTGKHHHLDSRSRAGMRSSGSRFGLWKDDWDLC